MSISDIKNMEIKNYQLIMLLIVSLNFLKKGNIFILFSFSFLLLLIAYRFQNYIGGGDIKVFILLSIIFKMRIILIMFLSSLIALMYCFLLKKKKVPFIPFIFISTIICLILNL